MGASLIPGKGDPETITSEAIKILDGPCIGRSGPGRFSNFQLCVADRIEVSRQCQFVRCIGKTEMHLALVDRNIAPAPSFAELDVPDFLERDGHERIPRRPINTGQHMPH